MIITTADGEAREARMWPYGAYSCPFCDAAVPSAESWADMQQANAEIYARQGDEYTAEAYPRYMRECWEARTCPNPCCVTRLDAAQLTVRREQIAQREAEEARRKRQHAAAMDRIRETREADAALWADLAARAKAAGQCVACLRASYWRSEHSRRVVRHRDPANCPQARKYALSA